jgi:poly(3-hydroxybutyrate) depolymerase
MQATPAGPTRSALAGRWRRRKVAALALAGLLAVPVAAAVPSRAVALDAPALGAGDRDLTTGGRVWRVHRPTRGRANVWLVVYLHSFGHGREEGPSLGWSAASDHFGFTVVYPEGGGAWNAGLCCGSPRTARDDRDDGLWLARVLAAARARYPSLRYTVLAGYSNGAMMAEALLASRPWLSGRIYGLGGAPEMAKPGRWGGRALFKHGSADTTVPWRGGVVTLGDEPITIRGGQETTSYLRGCRCRAVVLPRVGHTPKVGSPAEGWRFFTAR